MRRRLTLLSGIAVALTAIAASVIAYLAVESELRGEADRSLKTAGTVARRAAAREGGLPPRPRGRPGPGLGGPVIFGKVVDSRGRTITQVGGSGQLRSDSEYAAVARGSKRSFFADRTSDGDHLRVYVTRLSANRAFVVARTVDDLDAVLDRLRLLLGAVVLAGTALAVVAGRAIAGASLAPLQRLEDAAGHVASTQDLTRRIRVATHDEVGSLARQFNRMLDALEASAGALEDSVSAQRQLIADASHELRTPITTLRTNVEVLGSIERLSPDDRRLLLEDVESQLRDFSALIEDIIELARGDDPAGSVQREPTSVTAIVTEAVAWARRHWPGIEFRLHAEELTVKGYPERLARAFRNLLDNAGKWSDNKGVVEVTVRGHEVSVRDHGPGVSEVDAEHVFDRFYRSADGSDLPGSGLGLAIVRQVADVHGAQCRVARADGGGALFTLSFPAGDRHAPTGTPTSETLRTT